MSDKYPGGLVTAAAPAGYSVFFDGSGDYLVSSSSASNVLGAGDFTIEFWMLPNNTSSAYRALVSSENYSATTGGWSLYQNGTAIEFWLSPGGSVTLNATSAVVANTWQHLALCRASGTLRLFVNGVQVQSVSNSTSLTGQQFWLGGNNSGSFFFNGYMSNVRVVIGTALYTTTFTPPTQLFRSSIAGSSPSWNASLLTCNSPTIIDQSSSNLTFTVFGNAAVSTFTPFPSSYYFYNAPTNGNTRGMVPSNIAGFNPAYGAAAPGVWTLDQAQYFTANRLWPIYDPYFNLTTLMLPGNGTNGAQNNTFLDSSTNNFTITRNGNATQGTFSPFSQTGWGFRTNDRSFLTIPASSDFDLINTDFTVECWINVSAFTTMNFSGNNLFGNGLATAVNGWSLDFAGSGTTVTSVVYRTFASSSQATNTFSGLSFNFGTWNHLVLQRNGSGAGNLRLFLNGVQQGAAQTAVTYSSAGSTFSFGSGAYIQNGDYSGNADYFISNVRLTKSAVYSTSGFTPPTSNLSPLAGTTLLIAQSNRFINNGTNTGEITSSGWTATRAQVVAFSPFAPTIPYSAATVGGSGYFDGTGDFLNFTGTNLNLGTGAFTVEGWMYQTTRAFCSVISTWTSNAGTGFHLGTDNTGLPEFNIGNALSLSTVTTVKGATAIPLNTWVHLAATKTAGSGGTMTLYVNGVSVGTPTTTTRSLDQTSAVVARYYTNAAGNELFGYLSSIRVSNTVRTIAVPTAPYTSDGNTLTLFNFTNAGIIDAASDNVLETFGNAQISTAQSKFGGSSISFDGSGDRLAVQPYSSNSNLAVGAGDFTVECWAYFNSLAAVAPIICFGDDGAATGLLFYVTTAGRIAVFGNNGLIAAGATQTVTTGNWFHLAMSRSGTSLRLFVNGINDGTATNSTSFSSSVLIGAELFSGSVSAQLNGYLDDLRVTKFARYTANFVPPTSALQLQ